MRWQFLAKLVCVAIAVAVPAAAQPSGILVSPVLIEIPASRGVGSMTIVNNRAVATSFEVDVYQWAQRDGVDTLTPSRDIAVTPSVFELDPGGGRIVRVAMAPALRDAGTESAFRLIVRELPPETLPGEGPTILLEMSIPIFATVRGCAPTLHLTRQLSSVLTLANAGCAHARLLEVKPAPTLGVPRYLLAGADFTRAFPEFHDALRVVTAKADARTEQVLRVAPAPTVGGARHSER